MTENNEVSYLAVMQSSAIRNVSRVGLVIGALYLVGLSPAIAITPTVVAPASAANQEGETANVFPFGISGSELDRQHYEQLYDASLFAGIGPGGFITQLIFRPDRSSGPFSSVFPDIQINLSTTLVEDDALLLNFAQNVGADNTVVFERGSLTLSSDSTGPPGGPKDFDIVINLTTPFFYDPSQGNLLLEVRNFGGGTCPFFDAQQSTGDGVARLFTTKRVDGTPTTRRNSLGLMTGFTIVPAN